MTRVLNAADRGEGPYLWRFTRLQITLHVFIIISFLLLVLTGLPCTSRPRRGPASW